MRHNFLNRIAMALFVLAGTVSSAFAVDSNPGDYTALPPGSDLVALYYGYSNSNRFNLGNAGEIPNSEFDYSIGVARYVHYGQLGGMPTTLQAFMPVAKFHSAKVGGVTQPVADGIGDLTLGAAISPIAAPPTDLTGTNLGATMFVALPTGHYDFGKVNIGSGTLIIDPQIGFQQGLGGGVFFDAYYDVAFALDHREQGHKVSTDPAHQLQLYLRYEFEPGYNAAIGYSGKRGGKQYVDGGYGGLATDSDQVRLWASAFLNPTTQIGGWLGYDTRAEGGFKSGPILQLRLLKIF